MNVASHDATEYPYDNIDYDGHAIPPTVQKIHFFGSFESRYAPLIGEHRQISRSIQSYAERYLLQGKSRRVCGLSRFYRADCAEYSNIFVEKIFFWKKVPFPRRASDIRLSPAFSTIGRSFMERPWRMWVCGFRRMRPHGYVANVTLNSVYPKLMKMRTLLPVVYQAHMRL